MGSKPRRQAGESKSKLAKIGSLTYKNYKPVEIEEGRKIYVSPEDEKKILLASKINDPALKGEIESERRDSECSDSMYEVPVECKSSVPVREEIPEGEGPSTPKRARHSFPFYVRKRRPDPESDAEAAAPKKTTEEEVEQLLKLPPHMREVKEEEEEDGSRGNKFRRLFRKSNFGGGIRGGNHEKVPATADPLNEQIPVEVKLENAKCEEDGSETRERRPGSIFNVFARDRSNAGKGNEEVDSEENGNGKRRSKVTLKSIFGIENEKRGKYDSFGETSEKEESEHEGATPVTAGTSRTDEEAVTDFREEPEDGESLKFPTNIPPRGRWGPKSRKTKVRSAPEMNFSAGESDSDRSEKREGTLSSKWKRNKKTRPVSFAEETIVIDLRSDTESADHGSADKSSVSKLTEEKQQKRFLGQLLDSLKRKNKDKVADNEALRNLPMTIDKDTEQQIQKDQFQKDHLKTDGIVYAELDMTRSPGNVVRRDDEKTEYAEIIHPKSNDFQRGRDELRKSRENLSGSREHLTEEDGSTLTPDGKKEAAV